MRHKVSKPKLNRPIGHRDSLQRNLAVSLIQHEYITTTKAKAKVVKSYIDRIITLAKPENESARRIVSQRLQNQLATDKVFNVLVKRYEKQQSGFTRLIKVGYRKGDNAELVKVMMMINKEKSDKIKNKKLKSKTKTKK